MSLTMAIFLCIVMVAPAWVHPGILEILWLLAWLGIYAHLSDQSLGR